MSETIIVDFETEVLPWLPQWARNDANVVELCKNSLSFRCDVFSAKTQSEKSRLARKASTAYGKLAWVVDHNETH